MIALGPRRTDLLVAGAGALVCVVAGLAAAHRQSISLLLLAGLSALALVVIFGELGFGTLLIWVGLSGPLYPLLSSGALDLPLSFDRLLVLGMGSWLVMGRRSAAPVSPAGRRLAWALGWLLVAYGVRAVLTTQVGDFPITKGDARISAVNTWIDAILLPVILYLVVARFAGSRERLLQLAGTMAATGGVLGAIGVAEKVGGFELASLSGGEERIDQAINVVRVAGPYSVPEVYAVVLLICLAATVWWMLARGSGYWTWGIVALALELGGIGVTLFRAAAIGAVLVLVAGFGLRPGRTARVVAVTLIAGGVLYLGYAELQSNRVLESRIQNTENISGRLATYRQGAEIFQSSPLVGVGVSQFVNAQSEVQVTVVDGVQAVSSPHSTFVGTLAEQGIVGFLPLVACMFAVWRLLAELRRRGSDRGDAILWGCAVGAAVAYLVMSATLSMLPYGPSNAFFAVMLGMVAARSSALARNGTEPAP